jgi:hypothetical protein
LVDLDADGIQDLISGSSPGWVYWFRNLGARQRLGGKHGFVNVGRGSAVFATDWDHDGDLDLVIGIRAGTIHLVPNEGTRQRPVFGFSTPLAVNGRIIRIAGGDAGPCVADWDMDGRKDLIVGCGDGRVLWFRNVGDRGHPSLAAPRVLLGKQHDTGKKARVCAADWNEDGLLDLLIGDFHPALHDPSSRPSPATAASEKPRPGASGFVWLCLRKPVRTGATEDSVPTRR